MSLHDRFLSFACARGTSVPMADRSWGGIERRYSEPIRHDHTLTHIEQMLDVLPHASETVLAAFWFHDVSEVCARLRSYVSERLDQFLLACAARTPPKTRLGHARGVSLALLPDMNRHRNTTAFAAVLVTMLAIGCGSSGGGGFNLISIEEEWQLGAQLSQDVAKQVRFSNDPTMNAYVRSMGQKIVAGSSAPFNQLPWEFHIVNDPALNAFAIPGGHIYVHTGLIANANNAAELAGVMAHEISHVVARHSTEQISRQYGLSVLAGLVLGQDAGALQRIAAEIVAGGALARFSREAEREADKLGIQAMYRAGYDPRGMASMFAELLEHQQRQPSRVEQFFATHPTTTDRVRDAERRAAELSLHAGLVRDEPGFQDARRRATTSIAGR